MGQLTNQFVSQSYQGLLNLANANTGFTTNLQTVTDGLGGSSPLQISQTQVNISGTFTVNGAPVSVDTGSLVTTSSFNAYTSSVDLRFDGIELETGSLQNQINQKLDTGSFNSYTASNDSKVNSLIASTGSYATTSSLTAVSQSIATTDLAQNNRLTSIESITGSLATTGSLNSYTLTSSFNAYTSSNDTKVNDLISKTGSYVTETESGSFVTNVSQNPFVNDQIVVTKGNGSQSVLTINNVTSASFAQNAVSASWANNSNRNGLITTGSAGGSQSITGSLNVGGTITATSASFTYVNTVYETASVIYSSGSNQLGDASDDTQTLWGTVVLPSGSLDITGSIKTDVNGLVDSGIFVNSRGQVNLFSNGGDVNLASLGTGSITLNSKTRVDGNVVVTGSVTATQGFTGSLQGTASFATNALSASFAPMPDVSGFATTGSNNFFGQENITGSVKISESGSAFGDALLITSGRLRVDEIGNYNTGLTINGGGAGGDFNLNGYNTSIKLPALGPISIGGNTQLTGSLDVDSQVNVATNLNVTQSLNVGGNSTFNNQTYYNGNIFYNADSFIKTGSQINFNIGDGEDGKYYRLSRKFNGEFGIVQDPGNLHLFDISSSFAEFLPPTYFISGAFATGSLQVRSGSLSTISNNTTLNIDNFLTSSLGGQSNIIKGWGDNQASAGAAATQANYTGSLRITGSNNIVSLPQIRGTFFAGGTDVQGYISGSDNTIASNNAGIYLNTGSLLFPKLSNNYVGNLSSIIMNFTTSSLAGGHPLIQNNTLYAGGITINSNSGSVQTVGSNLLNGGQLTSTQNFVTNQRPTIGQNIIINSVTLNHLSSSINYQSNISNASLLVNNAVSSSITLNSVGVLNNTFLGGAGGGHQIFASGSQSNNTTRNIVNNLIGGASITVSSSFVSSSNSNLVSTIVYGNNLIVSGSHNTGTLGGSAYFGRFNDTGSSVDTQTTVFAVGSGTNAANRRTSLWIGNNGITNISGSIMLETANDATTGSLALMTARNGVQLWSYNTTTLNSSWGATNNIWQVGGSFGLVSGSVSNAFYGGYAGQAFRSGSNNIMFNSTFDNFISGSNNLFIGQSNNGLAGGSNNVIIGPIAYPSGSIVNGRFQINLAGGAGEVMTRNGAGAPLQIASGVEVTGSLRVSGDVMFASGSNTTMGTVVLDGANPGTATVSNSLVSANSLIFLTKQTLSNSHMVAVTSKGTGTFTITSNGNGDTDTVAYLIINPA